MNRAVFVIIGMAILLGIGFFAFNNSAKKAKQMSTMDNTSPTNSTENTYKVTPISHATMVLNLSGQVIYTDPVGGKEAFANQPSPNIILVTDIHGDHLEPETLSAVSKEDTTIIVPQAVADTLPQNIPGTIVIMKNGERGTQKGIQIEAVPMYNVPETPDSRHTKGRGNGYILEAEGKRIYIAGDTADTPEMRALQNIDIAFVPMNLPFTMSVESAADAVLDFKPKVVHPYHYRGQGGLSDINKFKELVEKGEANIKVELLNFYPEK